jgi:hypothetical protein
LYGAILVSLFQDPQYIVHGFDFYWAHRAARDLIAGVDPYGHSTSMGMVPYPLPAAFVGLAFSWLPASTAGAVFFGTSSALLAYLITGHGARWQLLLFVSTPYLLAAKGVQWAPLLMCVPFLPALLPLVLVKPTIGVVVLLQTRLTRWNVGATIVVAFVSLLVAPSWPMQWLSQTRGYTGFVPFLTVPGLLLLLAIRRWRDARARTLLSMGCVPQQLYLYDTLLLWRIPRTERDMVMVTAMSWALFALTLWGVPRAWWPWAIVMTLYWPSLALVLLYGRSAERSGVRSSAAPASDSAPADRP